MSLIPYHESEKSGSILYSRTGEVLGSRMDFKVCAYVGMVARLRRNVLLAL